MILSAQPASREISVSVFFFGNQKESEETSDCIGAACFATHAQKSVSLYISSIRPLNIETLGAI